MSFNEEENNNPFPSGIDDKDVFIDLPIDEGVTANTPLSNGDLLPGQLQDRSHLANQHTPINNHLVTKLYSQKIEDLLVNSPNAKDTEISIIEATKSNENDHPATSRSYIIYTIKIADDIIVKRRYSEFENLRNLLVKLYPLRVVPPIPEKQSIKSNFSLTGIQLSALKSNSSDSSSKTDFDTTNYVEYRKRLLTSFIKRCVLIDEFRTNFIFLTFLDPHPNFNEFIHIDSVGKLNATSNFKLSPVQPLASLEDELYATLPEPSEHSSINYKGSGNSTINNNQLAEYTKFETKFKEYEAILSNVSKYNKNLIKSMSELSLDYTEVGLYFNSLSLEEDSSPIIEKIGQVFDSSFFDINLLKNLINLKFLEKVIELRNFIKVVRGLIVYSKRKWLQSVEIVRLIEHNHGILEGEQKLDSLSKLIDDAMSKSRVLHSATSKSKLAEASEADDEETLKSLISQLEETKVTPTPSSKLFGYTIPGLKKVNKAILSMSDPNPQQTRKETIVKTKLKILTLKKQYAIVTRDNKLIDEIIKKELAEFQDWFKMELNALCYGYARDLKEFFTKSQENWQGIET